MTHEETLREVVLHDRKWLAYYQEIVWAIETIDLLRNQLKMALALPKAPEQAIKRYFVQCNGRAAVDNQGVAWEAVWGEGKWKWVPYPDLPEERGDR